MVSMYIFEGSVILLLYPYLFIICICYKRRILYSFLKNWSIYLKHLITTGTKIDIKTKENILQRIEFLKIFKSPYIAYKSSLIQTIRSFPTLTTKFQNPLSFQLNSIKRRWKSGGGNVLLDQLHLCLQPWLDRNKAGTLKFPNNREITNRATFKIIHFQNQLAEPVPQKSIGSFPNEEFRWQFTTFILKNIRLRKHGR